MYIVFPELRSRFVHIKRRVFVSNKQDSFIWPKLSDEKCGWWSWFLEGGGISMAGCRMIGGDAKHLDSF